MIKSWFVPPVVIPIVIAISFLVYVSLRAFL